MHFSSPGCNIRASSVRARLFFDTYCIFCARIGQPGIDLCRVCQQLLKARNTSDGRLLQRSLCLGCGDEFYVPSLIGEAEFCQLCSGMENKLFGCSVVPYRYAFPLDKLIKRLKYQHDRQLARVLGTLLARSVLAQSEHARRPQLLIPMPLHVSRQRERGFNQAQDIARWCGFALGIDVAKNKVHRLVDTGSMAGLSRAERQYRILGAFRASDSLAGKHVAIVDDVLTTGATARELAREIYDCGAESVELWALARTSSRRTGV